MCCSNAILCMHFSHSAWFESNYLHNIYPTAIRAEMFHLITWNISQNIFTCLDDLKHLKLQDATVALEQTPKSVGHLPSKQIGLTGRRRCYRTASWQCENEPLWLGGCWAAGTGGRCAWISVAVIIIGEERERQTENKFMPPKCTMKHSGTDVWAMSGNLTLLRGSLTICDLLLEMILRAGRNTMVMQLLYFLK